MSGGLSNERLQSEECAVDCVAGVARPDGVAAGFPKYHQGGRPAGSSWEYQAKTIRNGRWHTHQLHSDWSDSATVTLSTDVGGL